MADQCTKEVDDRRVANRHRQADHERVERFDRWVDLMRRENHFNFIKMHYLTHFATQYGILDPYQCILQRWVN